MVPHETRTLEMVIHEVSSAAPRESDQPLHLKTSRGDLHMRFYEAPHAERGVLYVGGVGGGWDSPACEM